MNSQKVSKGNSHTHVRKVPEEGTPAHAQWLKNMDIGRREAKLKRHQAGLLTLSEVAEKYGLPPGLIRRLADRRELPVIDAGARRYVKEADAERLFGSHSPP